MRYIYLFIVTLFMGAGVAHSQELFQKVIVPDTISTLTGRCNYLATHYWDQASLPQLMSRRAGVGRELDTYLNIIVNAETPVAQAGIKAMMKSLEKQPQDQLFMAERAEGMLYADSALTWVDELYLPFLEAVTANKRIDKAQKARFEHQKRILSNSLLGAKAASLPLTRPDGTNDNLDNYNAQALVVMFYDPDCDDCHLARMRLNGDIATSELVRNGTAKIVAVSMTGADDTFKADAATWPEQWVVAASEDADMTWDLRGSSPTFYVIDRDHVTRFKNLGVDQVLDIMHQLYQR